MSDKLTLGAIALMLICSCQMFGCSHKSFLDNQLSNAEVEALIATPTSNSELEAFIEDVNHTLLPIIYEDGHKIDLHDIRAILRINCSQSPDCKEKNNVDPIVINRCIDASLNLIKSELKKYPKCKSEIQNHYKATHFCMMLSHLLSCREEIPDLDERANALMKDMQSAADCMKIFLPDISTKDNCIMQQSTADEYYEEQIAAYCRIAESCKASPSAKACENKYKDLFIGDKSLKKDCTKLHKEALLYELKFVKRVQNKLPPESQCEIISAYESSYRIETLFAQSKTIDDYRFALMDEVQKPADQQRLTKTMMLAKYSNKVIDDSNFMQEYYTSTANYEACMIGHLSPN
ncbi:MAG: hypothetical protein II180_10275 [Proteobacteria bacterium]|nr:hypothetical protein [Pseudomonadota bacterium]